jgi:serine/threonine protein kinase
MISEAEICTIALGGDPNYLHQRILGRGGFAYVHQVLLQFTIAYCDIDIQLCDGKGLFSYHCYGPNKDQSWARKMLHQYPRMKPDDIQAEIKAQKELCCGEHHNIVRLFESGPMDNGWFYIDMELCEFTLTEYIYYEKTNDGLPCFNSLESKSRVQRIWDTMMQISDGVKFIHDKRYVHRDLKPNNSDPPKYIMLIHSSLQRLKVEDC